MYAFGIGESLSGNRLRDFGRIVAWAAMTSYNLPAGHVVMPQISN
jgi:hypothetical protein